VRTISALLGTLCAGAFIALGASIPLARGDAKPSTISVSEIKDGMKGYGLTVFKGTQPERFDVEVIGVLHQFRPGEELIVIKTPNARLDVVKTVRGMSGSPIYIDGRLAGAYSYSMSSFEIEPVAGVTPIDLMLAEMRRPIPSGFWPLERTAPLPDAKRPPPTFRPAHASIETFDGPPGTYDLQAHAVQLAARLGSRLHADPGQSMSPAATPLMMAGVGDRAAAALRKLLEPLGLEPLQGGGGSGVLDRDAPTHFVNGGGLGVELARGDVSVMGLGTATYVDGAGRVAGFGHPMLNGGDSAIPTCIGRILWVNASALASHKIGECARPLGTLVQDRQTAIVLDENLTAPTIPVDLDIVGAVGAPKTHWHAEITHDKFMAAGMSLVVLGSVIEATTSERRDLTWKLRSKVEVAGHGEVDLEDVGISAGGTPDEAEWGRSKLVSTIGDVLNNPWEHARITKIDAKFEISYARDLWRLRGVELLDPVVDAGTKARLRLHLMPQNGPEVTRVVEVTMPAELAGKDVDVDVVPGYDVVPELAPPEGLDELLANEPRQTVSPRALVLQFRVPSQGIAYRGRVTERLPPLTLDALRPQSNSQGPDAFPSWSRTVVPLDWYVEGHDKVKVKVRAVVR
jgi:SpoIVB peptidase S55